MARFVSIMRYFLIVIYAAAIVSLGAHDLAKRYDSRGRKEHSSQSGVGVADSRQNHGRSLIDVLRGLGGPLGSSPNSASSSKREGTALTNEPKPLEKPLKTDTLTRSDRKELDQLLEKVGP